MSRLALIVDDSRSACRFLAKLLAEQGLESESVNSAEDALEYLRDKKPDVIFLDHNMPGMNGLETVRIIKGNPETATIPVLMYTTQEGEVYLGQARALGAVDVLSKDNVHERLEESLARLGMVRGVPAEAGEQMAPAPAAAPDWEALLGRVQSELSRQMYLILAEEQIAQKGQMRWLADNFRGQLESTSDETVRRLEAKQDLRWEEQRTQGRARFILLTTLLVVLVVVVSVGFWWQLQRMAVLEHRYAADIATGQRQLEALRGLVEALPVGGSPALSQAPVAAPAPAQTMSRDAAVLQAEGGMVLGRLLGTTGSGGAYEGLSDTGYLFRVDARGEIGFGLHRRYFASADCAGDPLVDAPPGLVFRDSIRELWYTELGGQAIEQQPLSMITEAGECQPVEEEVAPLRPLLPNDPLITGLSLQSEPAMVARP